MKVRQVRTAIPGWFDADWLATRQKKCKACKGAGATCVYCQPPKGSLIRSRVPVTTKKITEQLVIEEKRLAAQFGGNGAMRLMVVPKLVQNSDVDIDLSDASDTVRVENYVTATMPEAAQFTAKAAVAYMVRCLSGIAHGAAMRRIRYLSLEGRNVLSFRDIKIRYAKQGLVLLRGHNRDWVTSGSKSNGAGKTSCLALLPIALCGQNPKGQKSNGWANEHTRKTAVVKLIAKDDRGRRIKITRGRRPAKILLEINGEDVSTGIRGTGKNETQGQIARETGVTLKTLLNSVYIDQSIASGFLFGGQRDKMDLVAKLQDLDRYEAALKATGADIADVADKLATAERTITQGNATLEQLKYNRRELVVMKVADREWLKASKLANKEFQAVVTAYQGLKGTEPYAITQQKELDALTRDSIEVLTAQAIEATRVDAAERAHRKLCDLIRAGKCPTCFQPCKTASKTRLAELKKPDPEVAQKLRTRQKKLTAKKQTLQDYLTQYHARVRNAEQAVAMARQKSFQAQRAAEDETRRVEAIVSKRAKLTEAIKALKLELVEAGKALHKYSIKLELLYYVKSAFHRSGMPLYLSASLCSMLCSSAESYSELFWDGKVKVNFAIEDGELVASIVNPSGSGTIIGQSTGERAMAGQVAAFALRDASPQTNLLILDEPGYGLDEDGQKQFAEGLIKLRDSGRYETIIVTTHSQVISGVLESEAKIWTVTKRRRRSRLEVA